MDQEEEAGYMFDRGMQERQVAQSTRMDENGRTLQQEVRWAIDSETH